MSSKRIATAEMVLWIVGALLALAAAVGFRWMTDWPFADRVQWNGLLWVAVATGFALIIVSLILGFMRRRVAAAWAADSDD